MEKTRLLIVDDLPEVREGLRTLLELHDGLEVVGEAATGLEGAELAGLLHPDIAIIDLEMPGQDGLTTAEQITEQASAGAVVILTIHSNDEFRQRAAQIGVDAYVEKSGGVDHLIDVIREIRHRP